MPDLRDRCPALAAFTGFEVKPEVARCAGCGRMIRLDDNEICESCLEEAMMIDGEQIPEVESEAAQEPVAAGPVTRISILRVRRNGVTGALVQVWRGRGLQVGDGENVGEPVFLRADALAEVARGLCSMGVMELPKPRGFWRRVKNWFGGKR